MIRGCLGRSDVVDAVVNAIVNAIVKLR